MADHARPAPQSRLAAGFEPDLAFVEALRAGDPRAVGQAFDRYHDHVERVLLRVLGRDHELGDLVQEVFVQAMTSFSRFRGEPGALRAWLTSICVHVARNRIRHRRARWWMAPASQVDREPVDTTASPELVDTVRRTYEVLDTLPARERIPFALRYFDAMELTEVAAACEVSLATVKRRLASGKKRFEQRAGRDPVLREWMAGGRA